MKEPQLDAAVRRTRARFRRHAALARAARFALAAVAFASIVAASRAWLWPTGIEDAPLAGMPRAAILLALALTLAMIAIALWAWRRSQLSELAAARRIDEHLSLEDVVASAWAFGRTGVRGPAVEIAMARGEGAIDGFDPVTAFPRPRLRPRAKRASIAVALVVLGLAIGTLDGTLASALMSPPTESERRSADALERAARRLEARENPREHSRTHRRAHRELAAQARRVVQAARRGDRSRALGAIRSLEAAHQAREASARRDARRLESVSRALGALRPATSNREREQQENAAAQQAREMASLLRREAERSTTTRNRERERRMLERLSRAQAEAREQRELRERFARAAQELSSGNREEAAASLEEAARMLERMAAELGEARMMLARESQMFERAGELQRAMEMGRLGQEESEGEPNAWAMSEGEDGREGGASPSQEGRTLSGAIANRLAALGLSQSPGPNGTGSGPRRTGPPLPGLTARRSVHARSQVRDDGERATVAVRGMGANGEPTTEYRDVYPSYGVRVEEALADERIPPSRRRAVRRYFESIRPDEQGEVNR